MHACSSHAGKWSLSNGIELPAPLHVVVRRRDDEQQRRDLTAHILQELRALRREHAELAERFAALFQMPSPSQRRLPLGTDAHEHRQRLWGAVRGGAA